MKKILLASTLLLSTSYSLAWVPCAPICDLTCSGLAIALGSAQHVAKIGMLGSDAALLSMKADTLSDDYKAMSDDIGEAWDESAQDLDKKIVNSELLSLSYADAISDKFSGAAVVIDGNMKTMLGLRQELNLGLQNQLSQTVKEVMDFYYVDRRHEQAASVPAPLALIPWQIGKTRTELSKRIEYDGLQRLAMKDYISRKFGERDLLENASKNAVLNLPTYIFGVGGIDFKSQHDPYLAKVGSIPFRSAIIRRNQLIYESTPLYINRTETLEQADLYGLYLTQLNTANVLLLDRLNSTFTQTIDQ